MRYWEYTDEQLHAMSTRRLLSLRRSVRGQCPSSPDPEGCMGCTGDSPCPCDVQYIAEHDRWEEGMARLKSILDNREHVVRRS